MLKNKEPTVSYGEKLLREVLKLKYPNEKFKYNYRPHWMMDKWEFSRTGREVRYEIDIYRTSNGRAYEFAGYGHQFKNDKIKKLICEENGIKYRIIGVKGLRRLAHKVRAKEGGEDLYQRINYYASNQSVNATESYKKNYRKNLHSIASFGINFKKD